MKLQQEFLQLLSEGGAKTADVKASAESAASQDDAAEIEDEVPLNANGECEAVSRLSQRDIAGCLACTRASGHQVVVVGGV